MRQIKLTMRSGRPSTILRQDLVGFLRHFLIIEGEENLPRVLGWKAASLMEEEPGCRMKVEGQSIRFVPDQDYLILGASLVHEDRTARFKVSFPSGVSASMLVVVGREERGRHRTKIRYNGEMLGTWETPELLARKGAFALVLGEFARANFRFPWGQPSILIEAFKTV